MIFAEMEYPEEYWEFHEELKQYLFQHFDNVEYGLQSDSYLWIFIEKNKIGLDTFSSMKHQLKPANPEAHAQQVISVLQKKYKVNIYVTPDLEEHEVFIICPAVASLTNGSSDSSRSLRSLGRRKRGKLIYWHPKQSKNKSALFFTPFVSLPSNSSRKLYAGMETNGKSRFTSQHTFECRQLEWPTDLYPLNFSSRLCRNQP